MEGANRLNRVIMSSDDSQLIESALAGNKEAFGELVLKHQDRLFGTLVHMLGSGHDAHDVAQEAFLLAYEKLGSFRQESSFYSWLFRIAFNAAMSGRRKKRGTRQSLDTIKAGGGEEPEDLRSESDPSRNLQIEDAQRQVQAALNQLATEYRDAIILKEIEGFRYEEIASMLDCPIGTVRSRIHRARQLLKESLSRVMEREQKS